MVDTEKHKFKINDWDNENISVIIYSEEEFDLIKNNVIEHLLEEIKEKDVELTAGVEIKLADVIDKVSYEKKMSEKLTVETCKKIVEDLTEHKFKSLTDSHYIFVM